MKKASQKIQNSKKSNEETLADRLRRAIQALGYRHVSDFIKTLGVNKSTIYAILNNNTKDPGAKILAKLYYSGINLNWLITGQEQMLRQPDTLPRTEPGQHAPKPYPTQPESRNVEQKIKDVMEDMLNVYQRLGTLHDYATELEKLDPEQQKIFHSLVRTFLDSARSSR